MPCMYLVGRRSIGNNLTSYKAELMKEGTMRLVEHPFQTKQEAIAFAKGVEYVNDSSCTVSRIDFDPDNDPGPWVVVCGEEGDG